MNCKSLGVCAATALLIVAPTLADAFNGKRGTRVAPVNDAIFEVVGRASADGMDYWCGAADYARRALGAPWTARVFIAQGRAQSVTTNRKSAVQFTLNPGAAGTSSGSPSLSLNSLREGDNMTVQQAYSYCQVPRMRF